MKLESDSNRMTLADAAREIGVCVETVRNAVSAGRLEPVRGGVAGRVYYVTRRSVRNLLKTMKGN